MTVTETKFSIWLGHNWPGPYIVTYKLRKKTTSRTVVVNGVKTVAEAMMVADAEHHIEEDEIESINITIGHVAEASHHMDALRDFREKQSGGT